MRDILSPLQIGVRADGRPIHLAAGGSAVSIADWIPIEYDSNVIQRVRTDSAIERYGRKVVMRSKTKSIPRSAGITVTTGSTYSDDASANDEVTLTARRFIARVQIDEDDLEDASVTVDVIETKGEDWAISYADTFDNACLGVSGGADGTANYPFASVYYHLRNNDTDVSYTADTNYLSWDDDVIKIASTPDGTSLYERLSALFKKVETGKYWSQPDMLVIAHPGWREALRNCMDAEGHPIFVSGGGDAPDTLFHTPIAWSRGCRVSGTLSGSPTGNDLLVYANRRFLARGDRSGPETRVDDPRAQDDTDNVAVKFRARRAFKLTHPSAAAVLERVSD